MATQDPVRDVGFRPDADQALINRDVLRVLSELIARQAADHSAIEELRRKVD